MYTRLTTLPESKMSVPQLSGCPIADVNVLKTQSKKTLLKMCESSGYVLELCNKNPILNNIILTPEFKR